MLELLIRKLSNNNKDQVLKDLDAIIYQKQKNFNMMSVKQFNRTKYEEHKKDMRKLYRFKEKIKWYSQKKGE